VARELNYRQRLFVEAYLGEANGNATEAARIAGIPSPRQQGQRLLSNVVIQAAISRRVASAAMSANEVLARFSDLASGNLGEFIDIIGKGQFSTNLRRPKRAGRLHVLKKLKQTEHGVEIEIHDPLAALDKLAKYHGLYNDKGDGIGDIDKILDAAERSDDDSTNRPPGTPPKAMPQ
jgi:phage terminase small subunit